MSQSKKNVCKNYYHLRSPMKREHFFAYVYFSNETVPQTTVSTGPMKMLCLEHESLSTKRDTFWSRGVQV